MRDNDVWVRGDKFEHPSAYLMYQGKYETDLSTFITQANYELGSAFKYGQGVKKDSVESLKWYLLAANQGHSVAQFELGNIYAEGRGTEKNLITALNWYEKAAKTNTEFEYRLGSLYIEDKLLPQDVEKGLQKVKSAVINQNPNAQTYMGELYLRESLLNKIMMQRKNSLESQSTMVVAINLQSCIKMGWVLKKMPL